MRIYSLRSAVTRVFFIVGFRNSAFFRWPIFAANKNAKLQETGHTTRQAIGQKPGQQTLSPACFHAIRYPAGTSVKYYRPPQTHPVAHRCGGYWRINGPVAVVGHDHRTRSDIFKGASMLTRDASPTRDKILDACERLYARDGVEGLSLRIITESAEVNLAAVNYHFGGKDILITEMLKRRLQPIHDERLALLVQLEQAFGHQLHPTHVMSAILLPTMALMMPISEAHSVNFYLRCSSDPSPVLRSPMAAHFGGFSARIDAAFMHSAPSLNADDVKWKIRVFFNAFPGTVTNQNTLTMLRNMVEAPDMTVAHVLKQFGSVLECMTHGKMDDAQMQTLIGETLEVLAASATLNTLRQYLPLDEAALIAHGARLAH
jgi:AcrR family transcriptional regulator